MDTLLFILARGAILPLQLLPLKLVARLGRLGGRIAWRLDRRHRTVTIDNLTRCFGKEMTAAEIESIARENFRRLGENYASAIKTASMSPAAIKRILTVTVADEIPEAGTDDLGNIVIATGHFGNFELYARASLYLTRFQIATTYRALRQSSLNRLMQTLRKYSGCWFFERRTEARQLKKAMQSGNIMLGFLADQHAGDRGAWLPFFGIECSTSTAPAVFALRYNCPLRPAFCHRIGLARWEIEIGKVIPTHQDGVKRPVEDITLDMNKALEKAIRRDPANWFWVHRRWKPASHFQKATQKPNKETET